MPSLNSQHSSKAEHCNFEKKKSSASLLNLITVSKKFYRREQQSPFGHTIWHWSYIISRKPFKAQHACLSCPVKKGQSGAAFMAWFMLLLLPLQQCQLAQLHHHAPCTVQHDGLFCVTQCSVMSKIIIFFFKLKSINLES